MKNSKKIEMIRESAAMGDMEYLKVFQLLEQYCWSLLNDPENADNSVINAYNRIIQGSELKLPEKEQLYI